jgi:hypothetical protein
MNEHLELNDLEIHSEINFINKKIMYENAQ